ncbi:cobalt/nickel transport system ATP-binding protein [Singulisphaera sp. GP187]|uniref:energy-coupling factor ABC transporter ATP-binding protein n=1 Tax=Singulisphaera sp. GP187 TaxID=1882752 RepID=UPI000926331F|nr:ABC transporter ATP-binding protein [Singulisphaera sp. GP187]SIO46075.1 cobalt/nickel transport system ATP-binding protein [Singulisphaera sp. GP187]
MNSSSLTMTNDAPAVQVRELIYRYPDGRLALRGVDLTIVPGETIALVGPNGAGKSTLLLHLNGILPGKERSQPLHAHGNGQHARNGSEPAVWIDGLEVNAKNAPEVRRRVGLVFQDPDDQLFSTSVIEDVAFGPLNLGMSRAEAKRVALECLARVNLDDVADRAPHHLSFGERKRVCLAGVLACNPSVLVLDEPTANLDPRGRRRFIELIRGLTATKLIATHDLEMVLELCNRTVLLDSGRIVANGLTRNVLGDPNLLEAHGLEMPLSLKMGRLV